jgi:HlyD family secretion protein
MDGDDRLTGRRSVEIPPPGAWRQWRFSTARSVAVLAGASILLAATYFVLRPALPRATLAALTLDEVQRGDVMMTMTAPGSLRPVNAYAISATSGGVIRRIVEQPGARVEGGAPLIVMLNAELERQLLEAEAALADEENRFTALESQTVGEYESAEYELQIARTELAGESAELAALEQLIDIGAVAKLQYERQKSKVETYRVRIDRMADRLRQLERRTDKLRDGSAKALEQRRKVVGLLREKVAELTIRAPSSGVLTALGEGLREGLTVQPGLLLAEVSRDQRLEARASVPASRAFELALGQRAYLINGAERVPARVSQIDPQVRQDEVGVLLALDRPPLSGFRAGLTVMTEIETKPLKGVLHVRKPSSVGVSAVADVWVLDGDRLVRKEARFGPTGGDRIVIEGGLSAGEKVVVGAHPDWGGARVVALDVRS